MPFKTVKFDSKFKLESLNGLKVLSLNGKDLLILWHKHVVTVFHITYPVEKLNKCFGVFHFANEIKDVILTKSILLCLSGAGLVYLADLHDGIMRIKGLVIEHKEFKFAKNVVSFSATSEGFLLLTGKGELMSFRILRMENGNSKISLRITRNVPGHIGQVQKNSYVTTCQPAHIHTSLASLLFKDIALLKCDIIFLGLDNGNVYWLPLLDNIGESTFNLIHSSTSAIKDIIFATDGKAQKSNHILILSSYGSVAVINQVENQLKCKVHHLPGSIHCSSLAGTNTILHSDGLNLWQSEINLENNADVTFNTQLLHVKGVVALANNAKTNEVIVGCRHCILYRMSLSSPNLQADKGTLTNRSETCSEIGSLLREWHNATQELNFLKEIISTENKVMREMSTATRGIILKDMIKLKIDVSDNFPFALKNTLALRVTNQSPQEFSNEFWLFHIQVNSGEWNVCMTEKLESSFKPNGETVFIVPVDAEDLKFPVTVDCSLVLSVPMGECSNKDDQQFHEIPMQRVFLDVTNFLTPIPENFLMNHQSLSREDATWDQFLARFRHVSSMQGAATRKGESQLLHCYTFRLPETLSWSEFKDQMMKKTDQRLQFSVYHANRLKFRVRHCIITFTCSIDNETVNIVTTDKYILGEIQAFIANKVLSENNDCESAKNVCVDEGIYFKLRNINLALEVETEKGASWKNLSALKRELRNLSDLHLPDWKNS